MIFYRMGKQFPITKNSETLLKSSFGVLFFEVPGRFELPYTVLQTLTKPLIQGTGSYKNSLFLVCGCKGSTFFETTNYPQQLFFFFFVTPLHSARFLSYKFFSSQPLAQLSHGLPFSLTR